MAQLLLTLPVGRMVQGDLYTPQTTDADGNPLTVKSGPNAGKPKQVYFFSLAIPKNPGETSWTQTHWGQRMHAEAQKLWPRGEHARPDFAFKVTDGDLPNSKGNKIAEAAGCWLLRFQGGYEPNLWDRTGSQRLTTPGTIKCGDYLEVYCSYDTNGSNQKPGMYLNYVHIAHAAFGEPITQAPAVSEAGFGRGQLPPGASVTPPAGAAAAFAAQQEQTPPAAAVVPNPAFTAPPPPPAGKVMTAKAAGATYEQYIAQGWTDALLIQHGFMQP